ncbi:MAG: PspC domain-containing protein [Bacteroidales bacterium]|nr:PspC domain-containing protein [Candidatus Cacconaster merdequi]
MNKIEKVNIGGYAFALEDKAFVVLNQYLNELESHYSSSSDCKEIIDTFEERIAEILVEEKAAGTVVGEARVNRVIEILGRPQPQEKSDNDSSESKWWSDKPSKKIMRDPYHRIIGGVCSGLAAYLKVDVVIVRLVWVALTFISMILSDHYYFWKDIVPVILILYPLLWIIMPSPHTEKERRALNVSAGYAETSEFWTVLGKICRLFFGILLIMVGIMGLMSCLAVFLGWDSLCLSSIFADEMQEFDAMFLIGINSALSRIFGRILLVLSCVLPFILMIWGGVRLLFNLKPVKWHPGLICFIVWFVSLLAFFLFTILGVIPVV